MPAADRRAVLVDELAHLIDGADAVHVTLALGAAPGEQTVPAEHDAVTAGSLSTARRSISASSNPGRCHGTQTMLAAVARVELGELRLAVGAGRQRDRPVRMQVIDVIEAAETRAAAYRSTRRRDCRRTRTAGRTRPSRLRALRRDSASAAPRACRDTARQTRLAVIDRRSPPLPLTASTRVGRPSADPAGRTSSWCCRRRNS